jgi:hypothetical protein
VIRSALIIGGTLAAIALLVALFVGAALSHEWYEPACCSGNDCAPVDDGTVVEKSDGVHVQGWGVLNRSDPRVRWSRDDRDHVCAIAGKLYCVYRNPNAT